MYFSQPTLLYWPIQTTVNLYYTEERNPTTQLTRRFHVDRLGASIQQERKLANSYVWNYGLPLRAHARLRPRARGHSRRVARRTRHGFAVDQHLHPRDARRCARRHRKARSSSQAFSYSPSWLGSDGRLHQVPRPVLSLHPAAARTPRALHERNSEATFRVCGGRPARSRARFRRQRRPPHRAVLRGRQHHASGDLHKTRSARSTSPACLSAARRCW